MNNANYKVLLVEDNEIEQHAFKRFIESHELPYDCVIVGSVSEAQRSLSTGKFDIVISDHNLGDGTAFDILEFSKNTPVIVVTGAGDEETAVKAWKAGAYDYIIKDLDQNYLKAIPITVENAVKHNMVEKKLELLSGAIRSTEDSVYITDMKGDIIFVNKAFCKTYGYSEEEIVGKNSSTLWIGRNQSENTRSVFQTRSLGSGWEVGFYHKRKDESIFPVSLSRSTIKDANRNDVAIVGVARDISERILIEDEIRTTSLKLQKRNQSQNEIAITTAETIKKLLADSRTDLATKIVCDYLDISRLDTDAIELERTEFDFAVLASQVEEALSQVTTDNNIELKFSIPDSKLVIKADYDRMVQVLNNLLHRAIIFSTPNNCVTVKAECNDSELVVEIHDSGPPLEKNEIHRIVKSSDWIKEQFRTGREELALGLRIAKELVEMHGGRIWTQSEDEGRGNVLCFTIPKSYHNRKVSAEMDSAMAY